MRPPIADPNEIPQRHFDGDDTSVFRFKFWPFFGAMFSVAHFFGLITLLVLFRIDPVTTKQLEQIMVVALVANTAGAALASALSYWVMPLKAGSWGLRAFNTWAGAREIEWNQIETVKFRWVFVFYAILKTTNGKKLWIVIPLENPRGFADVVVANTAPDHSLHRFVVKRGWLK